VKTLGLIGTGHIGSQRARLAVKNGYDVVVSNSRGPQTLADLVRELGPRARGHARGSREGRRPRRRHNPPEQRRRRASRAARYRKLRDAETISSHSRASGSCLKTRMRITPISAHRVSYRSMPAYKASSAATIAT